MSLSIAFRRVAQEKKVNEDHTAPESDSPDRGFQRRNERSPRKPLNVQPAARTHRTPPVNAPLQPPVSPKTPDLASKSGASSGSNASRKAAPVVRRRPPASPQVNHRSPQVTAEKPQPASAESPQASVEQREARSENLQAGARQSQSSAESPIPPEEPTEEVTETAYDVAEADDGSWPQLLEWEWQQLHPAMLRQKIAAGTQVCAQCTVA